MFGWEILIALVVGLFGSFSGIAGGPFIVFMLAISLGYSQHSAQGTVLAMMLGPMTILPMIYGWQIVRRRWREIVIAVISYMIFSYAGAEIAYLFDSSTLGLVFGTCITVVGILYLIFAVRNINSDTNTEREVSSLIMVIIGAFVGTVGGMSGIGAGILLVPILTAWLRMEQREAQTVSLAILLPPVSLGAVFKYGIAESDIVWAAAWQMLLAYIVTSGFGYVISRRYRAFVLQVTLSVLLVLAGIIAIIQSY